MPADLTPAQLAAASADITRPIYLVCLEHAGVEELLSSSGDVVFDGQNYLAGGIAVSGISNTRSATLTLPWSATRVTEIQNGSYRGGKCKIWYIPGVPSDTDLIFDAEDGVLVMDGEIRSSRFSGDSVSIAVTHINNGNVFTPRNTLKQVTNFALPPGTLITWEGETRQLESRRFGAFDQAYAALGRGSVASGRAMLTAQGRLPASTLKEIATPPRDQTLTVAGSDAPIPIVYGRRSLPGLVTLRGDISGDLVLGVVWCLGEIIEIEDVYINGEAVPAGVTQTDYLGLDDQTVDSTLATAIAAFNDPMLLETPNGTRGIAYSVFRIPAGQLDGSPTFQAVVKGMRVSDPRNPQPSSPVYPSARYWRINVTESRSSGTWWANIAEIELRATAGGADQTGSGTAAASTVDSTSLNADKAFDNNSATFWSSDGGAALPQWISYDFGAATTVSEVLIQAGNDATRATRAPKTFQVQYSSDGSTWETAATITDTPAWSVSESRTFQIPDTRDFSGYDNPALCFADLAGSPVYGLGATVQGVDEAADWCDELIDGFARARIGLELTQIRRTEEYLDLLATYAECLWYNEGAAVQMVPDKIVREDNPSGLDVVVNGDFASSDGWTVDSPWAITAGVASIDGTGAGTETVERVVDLEEGALYAVKLQVSDYTSGLFSVEIEDDEGTSTPILDKDAVGTYTALITARAPKTGGTLIRLVAGAGAEGDVTLVECKRLYYLEENCVKGSLDVEGVDDGDTPTKVICRYTSTAGTAGVWSEAIASASLPGVESGDTRLVETTLSMPGIYRVTEATSKANARLQRMRNRVRVSWVTTDKGIKHRIGDVIQHRMPYRGTDILVKLTSVDLVGYGRYRVAGLRYDEAHYPDEIPLPEDVGTVPVGAIVPLSGASIPSGWAAYTDADGKYIVGAGDTYAVGDTGGSLTATGWSGLTDTRDMHSGGGGFASFLMAQSDTGVAGASPLIAGSPPNTDHAHTFSIGTLTPDLPRRENRLIIKTGSADTNFPASAQVFGLPNLLLSGLTRVVTSANRLLVAETANANAGVATLSLSGATGSGGVDHTHLQVVAARDTGLGFQQQVYSYITTGGAHTHSFNLTLSRNVKKKALALYGSDGDFAVIPGMIVLWSGSLGSLPTDWVLCDGAGSTPDMRDYFIEIAPEGGEGASSGDNTLTVDGNTSSHGHSHIGSASQLGTPVVSVGHADVAVHNHTISATRDWVPPYYALAAIMYSP
jgi:hypothetical protein